MRVSVTLVIVMQLKNLKKNMCTASDFPAILDIQFTGKEIIK